MTSIRLHFALILDTSSCEDPERAVQQFLHTAEFADIDKTVEVVRGQHVVRYTVDGPETLTNYGAPSSTWPRRSAPKPPKRRSRT